jgi:K+-sensing histidine kinase KdpD
LGALVTLHDLESVEEIESELELSRRMAAIGRLTSGVGHEVKNPINAIVVHLELLKTKLGDASAPAVRHLEVIDAEIHRLDRVVQTLVDFSRPVELRLREQDLRPVIGDVLALAAEELSTHKVTLVSRLPSKPLVANIDADLLKQAVLNVIQNGAQAMPQGGRLEVILEEDGKTAVLRVSDEGPGIPEEIREKIFDLYFTTKSGGSGIGLAMTYRILQLHHGSVEVQSEVGRGAEFLLRIPLAATEWGRRHLPPASTETRKGLRDEVACQECCVVAAVVADGVLSQDPSSTSSAARAAHRGCASAQACAVAHRICPLRSSPFPPRPPRPTPTRNRAGASQAAGQTQKAPGE